MYSDLGAWPGYHELFQKTFFVFITRDFWDQQQNYNLKILSKHILKPPGYFYFI